MSKLSPLPSGLAGQVSPYEQRLAVRINDAAAMLGISRSSIYELIAEGKLKSALIAGRRVIPMSECQRLLSESTIRAA
jgi:excisionase family DNA binding protein